ncbi:MAG: glycosyltransferase family 2 protein [Methyloligellaceae bacterium]
MLDSSVASGDNRPMFSIVIPTYNRKDEILKAVDSVLKQTCQDFEIVIVDDGSTDGTKDAIDALGDDRIRYIKHEQQSGANAARNTGIGHAQGSYISFLDSDDIFLKNKLERISEEIEKFPEEAVFISSHKRIKSNRTSFFHHASKTLTPPEFQRMLHYYVIDPSTSGLTIRRSILSENKKFDVALRRIQDRELLLRLCNDHGCVLISDVLWQKSWSGDGIASHHKGYISALMDMVDRHPSFETSYRDALNYLIFRSVLKNLAKANISGLHHDIQMLRQSKRLPTSVWRSITDYMRVKKIRKSYKKERKENIPANIGS